MKKLGFAAALCLIVVAFSACNDNSEANTDTSDSVTTTATNKTSETTETTQITETTKKVEVLQNPKYDAFIYTPLFEDPLKNADLSNLPEGTDVLFTKAFNVWYMYNIKSMLCDEDTAETLTLPVNDSSYIFYRTNIAYAGFEELLNEVFTEEWIENYQEKNMTYINYDDELLCLNVEGVINSDFKDISFEITQQTDSVISFTGTANYVADDGYTYQKEYLQQLVKIGESWRLNIFNSWH